MSEPDPTTAPELIAVPEAVTAPEPQKPRSPLIWALPLVLLLIAGTAAVTYSLTTHAAKPTATASAKPSHSPTPSPTPTYLDERAACVEVVPSVHDAVNVMQDLVQHPDGSTIDVQQLTNAVDEINHVLAHGPADLKNYLTAALGPLRDLQKVFKTGANTQIDTLSFSLGAQAILDQCRPYAT